MVSRDHDEWCVAEHLGREEPALFNSFDVATVVVCVVALAVWYLCA